VVDVTSLPKEHRQWTPLARALAATGDQWTLLIILQLASGALRLSDLREHLPGVSTGVLNRHLQQMVDLDLLARQRFRELPPRVEYKLTPSGRALIPIVTALARWGMRYMWSEPQNRESVDIGTVLRLLPTLLKNARLPSGVVEMVIELPHGLERHLFNIDGGRLSLVAPTEMMPWTCMTGEPGDWITALGPEHRSAQLEVTGGDQIATAILEALPRPS
jgi:DNA-binding HxlR family transcriptional regulator